MNGKWIDFLIKVRLPILLFTVALAFAATYFISNPERQGVGYRPDQPIEFSHKLHAGDMKIDCQYCHVGADQSRHATIPSTDTCMNCHTLARTDTDNIKKLHEFAKSGESIPWVRIHKVPEFVYFNHSVHVNNKIPCQSCHGPVEQMDKIEQVRPFSMSNCLSCHNNAHAELDKEMKLEDLKNLGKGPTNCSSCHR